MHENDQRSEAASLSKGMGVPKVKYYTGVGSRDTPYSVCSIMTSIASTLEPMGYVLRSGGAPKADVAFSRGCRVKEIYLPWHHFNQQDGIVVPTLDPEVIMLAAQRAAAVHPAWHNCSPRDILLLQRDSLEVTGQKDELSEFLVCWTIDGKAGGGTGQTIRIAQAFEIPVFDLAIDGKLEELEAFILARNQ